MRRGCLSVASPPVSKPWLKPLIFNTIISILHNVHQSVMNGPYWDRTVNRSILSLGPPHTPHTRNPSTRRSGSILIDPFEMKPPKWSLCVIPCLPSFPPSPPQSYKRSYCLSPPPLPPGVLLLLPIPPSQDYCYLIRSGHVWWLEGNKLHLWLLSERQVEETVPETSNTRAQVAKERGFCSTCHAPNTIARGKWDTQ